MYLVTCFSVRDEELGPAYEAALADGYELLSEAESGVSDIYGHLAEYVEKEMRQGLEEWGADPTQLDVDIGEEDVLVTYDDDSAEAVVYQEAYGHSQLPVARIPLVPLEKRQVNRGNKRAREFKFPSEDMLEVAESNIRHLLKSQQV